MKLEIDFEKYKVVKPRIFNQEEVREILTKLVDEKKVFNEISLEELRKRIDVLVEKCGVQRNQEAMQEDMETLYMKTFWDKIFELEVENVQTN